MFGLKICLLLPSLVGAQCCIGSCGPSCSDAGAWCAQSPEQCSSCGGQLCSPGQMPAPAAQPVEPSQPAPASGSSKQGIALSHPSQAQLLALQSGASWFYDWSHISDQALSSSKMAFFPMVHDAGQVDQSLGGQFSVLLGFNEPSLDEQGHLSPSDAAALWPRIEGQASAAGVQKLVSPAMCGDIGRGTSWMQSFLGACQGCRIDAIAVHSYTCDLSDIQQLVEAYRGFGKPIWLTEFACAVPGRDVSVQGQMEFMKQVVPWLEQESVIEKYAWFSFFTNEWSFPITNPNPDAGLVYPDGRLSELGQLYLSLGSGGRRLGEEVISDSYVHV